MLSQSFTKTFHNIRNIVNRITLTHKHNAYCIDTSIFDIYEEKSSSNETFTLHRYHSTWPDYQNTLAFDTHDRSQMHVVGLSFRCRITGRSEWHSVAYSLVGGIPSCKAFVCMCVCVCENWMWLQSLRMRETIPFPIHQQSSAVSQCMENLILDRIKPRRNEND